MPAEFSTEQGSQVWRPIGPFCIPHGQTYGSGSGSRPAISGRVSAIAVDPANPDHILLGAAAGGIWETRNLGATWAPRTDDQPSLATGAIAFDPSNPSVVYAGTGEGDSFASLGAGLLRSTDGGTTWSMHAQDPFFGLGFLDLIVDPTNAKHLLAAIINPYVTNDDIAYTGGVFESTDGGLGWQQRRSPLTWDLSMHPAVRGNPNSTKEIFAACYDGVFRSTDGGTNWLQVSLPGAPTNFSRIGVSHSPLNGGVVYVFAAGPPEIQDPVNFPTDPDAKMPTPYFWRRDEFGGNFSAFSPGPPDLQTGQASYDWFIAVAPNNPDVLYLGAINTHRGVRSEAGRWKWDNISAKNGGDSIHPDQHAIAFSPVDPNVIYIGCDGGLFRSSDAGVTWKSLNKGLSITEFEFLAQHPRFEAYLLAGTQDNGTLRYEGEEVWFHVQDGDGGDCGVNAASPYTCYHSFYGMGLERSDTGGGWGSWRSIGPNLSDNKHKGYGTLFYPPFDVKGTVIAQAGESVFISSDAGDDWQEVILPTAPLRASALAIANSTRVYVGLEKGALFRVDLSGGTWGPAVQLTAPLAQGFMSDLLVDPTNEMRLWATFSNVLKSQVFRSDTAGTSWLDVSAGLPPLRVNAIDIDPGKPDMPFVALDQGVYRATNVNGSWSLFGAGLPNALVKDLAVHPVARLLRAGTQSRGVWEIPLDAGTIPNVEIYLRDTTVDTGRVTPSVTDVDDPFSFGSKTFWWQCPDIKVDSPSFQTPAITDVDFVEFEDDHGVFAAGLNHENATRGQTARVFVNVHNRGARPAANVVVKVFYCAASLGFPTLPTDFWVGFPNNAVSASSPWQAVAAHKIVPSVAAGSAGIIGFEWSVPPIVGDHVSLLAIISADNDPISTGEVDVAALVPNNKKCGLKNLAVVNPPPSRGALVRVLKLDASPTSGSGKFSVGGDPGAGQLVRGFMVSSRLSTVARSMGLRKVKLTEEEEAELSRIMSENPGLREKLNVTAVYAPREEVWLKSVDYGAEGPEPFIVFVNPNRKGGYGNLIQWDENGRIVGGVALQTSEIEAR